MTDDEKNREIGEAWSKRQRLRETVRCLDNKRDRISKEFKQLAGILDELDRVDWSKDAYAAGVHFQLFDSSRLEVVVPTERQVVEVVNAYKSAMGELERLNRVLGECE